MRVTVRISATSTKFSSKMMFEKSEALRIRRFGVRIPAESQENPGNESCRDFLFQPAQACLKAGWNKKDQLRAAQVGIFLGTRLISLGSPPVIPQGKAQACFPLTLANGLAFWNKKDQLRAAQVGIFLGTRLIPMGLPPVILYCKSLSFPLTLVNGRAGWNKKDRSEIRR